MLLPRMWSFLIALVVLSTLTVVSSLRANQQRHNNEVKLSNNFPTLDDTVEMSALSLIVYEYRNELDDAHVCELINAKNFTATSKIPVEIQNTTDIKCHWFHHSRVQGTQVLIVSSDEKRYIAIVLAGTDDLRTALTDADLLLAPFGDGSNVTLPSELNVRVHAGFNNAVFHYSLFDDIQKQFDAVRLKYPSYRLFTTGHSLGAAESILIAVALTLQYQQQQQQQQKYGLAQPIASALRRHHNDKKKKAIPPITSINFGCPRMGNEFWRDWIHSPPANATVTLSKDISIWRFVLGWDLVPRLPEFILHVGHTVQLHKNDWEDYSGTNATAEAFYQHYGDENLGWAGVPPSWSAKPYIFVPGALWSHQITKYWTVLHDWANSSKNHREEWVHNFVRVEDDHNHTHDDDDDRPPNVDDDFYVNPPDDDVSSLTKELVPVPEPKLKEDLEWLDSVVSAMS